MGKNSNISSSEARCRLGELYFIKYGRAVSAFTPIAASGGDRKYWRLSVSGETGMPDMVGTYGNDVRENLSFIRLAASLRQQGVNVPEVYAVSDDTVCYLQQDLGDVSLFGILHEEGSRRYIEMAMRSLAMMQSRGRSLVESGDNWQRPFGRRQVMWDLNYFKYEFVKTLGISMDEEALEDDFVRFADKIDSIPDRCRGFMYRDCQSRNVMIRDEQVWWIDFQAARFGPCLYDAVSFLWQARAGFSDEERTIYLNIYATEYSLHTGVPVEEVLAPLDMFVALRTLQVLGAYGLRGLVEHRAHFVESIVPALRSLKVQLEKGVFDGFAELKRVCLNLVDDRRFDVAEAGGRLVVDICSFSYKRGYPENYTGNGGGFMFDCRAMHNPGRYERYKPLTGLDKEVIGFLEERGEVQKFLAGAWSLTDAAVNRYVERGFSNLQIGFGCTGGRHRSVYCAEATARHIKEMWGDAVVVRLCHREQGINREI